MTTSDPPVPPTEPLDLYRQWFNIAQDMNPAYLEAADYNAARSLYERLGMRVPHSIAEKCDPPVQPTEPQDPIGRIRAEIAHLNRMIGDAEVADPVGFLSLSARRDELFKQIAAHPPVQPTEHGQGLPAFILTKLTSAECDIVFTWKDKAVAAAVQPTEPSPSQS